MIPSTRKLPQIRPMVRVIYFPPCLSHAAPQYTKSKKVTLFLITSLYVLNLA